MTSKQFENEDYEDEYYRYEEFIENLESSTKLKDKLLLDWINKNTDNSIEMMDHLLLFIINNDKNVHVLDWMTDYTNTDFILGRDLDIKNYPYGDDDIYDEMAKDSPGYMSDELPLIYIATYNGCTKIVQKLCDVGYYVDNRRHDKAETSLIRAVRNKNLEMVKVLLKNKADVNAVNFIGMTPLMYAVQKNYFDIATELCKHNPNIHIKDYHSRETALRMATENKNLQMVELLSKFNTDKKRKRVETDLNDETTSKRK